MLFDSAILETLAETREIAIETLSEGRWHPTTIWVAITNGMVFVRSVRGSRGRWYQRALANPEVQIVFGGEAVAAVAVPTSDADSVERASRGFTAKYRSGRSLEAMLLGDVLPATLRLDPDV